MLKLFKPYMSWRARWYALRVLFSSQLAEGKWVKQFENEFAKKYGFNHVLALNSGTSALELAYDLAGIKRGDEVLSPVLTCTATNVPLARRGAKIKWVDTDLDLNIDIDDLKKKITKRTKAIVFVHFGGSGRGLRAVADIARKHHIQLIEDAAQSVGSECYGLGDFTCVSLQAIKTLTSGDGGFLITKSAKDYDKARRLRWFGYDREEKQKKGDTDLKEAGYKYHMNNITAAIGLGNLRSIDKVVAHRKRLLEIYKDHGCSGGLWMVSALVPDVAYAKRFFKELGIEVGQHHFRNDKYTVFGGRKKLPIMDAVENHYIHLPLHHKVTESQAEFIASTLNELQHGRED